MKIFFVIFSLLSIFVCSQEKVISCNELDSFYLKHQKERAAFFAVSQIQNMNEEIVYRFWNTNNLLELVIKKGKLTGKLIYAAKNVGGKNEGEFYRKIFELSQEDTENINKIFKEKYDNLKVLGWDKGFDGVSYYYERKIWNFYCENSYSTCCNDENEAKYYLEIKKDIESIIDYKSYYEIFAQEIPFRSYTYYGVAYSVINFKK